MHRRSALILLPALALAACTSHLGLAPPPHADLTGHWVLNEKLSDDPEKVVRAQQQRGHERRDRDRDRMAGDMENQPLPGVDPRTEPPTKSARTAYRRLWERALNERIGMLSAGRKLEVTQFAGELEMASDGSSARYVYGEKVIVSVPNGAADRYAGWDGRSFIVRTDAPDGPRLVRKFDLVAGGARLQVVSEISGDGQATIVRQVYDRVAK